MDYASDVLEFIQANGWLILITSIIVYYIYNKYKSTSVISSDSSYKKEDEGKILQQMQNIEAVRLRQQAAIDAAAMKYREEKLKKEEMDSKRRQEEWELHQQGLGSKNKQKKNTHEEDLAALGLTSKNKNLSSKPRLKDSDYNPLMGNSGGERPTFRRAQPSRGG